MLKGSKNAISKTHDQLLNVINKIPNCYRHRHYYRNNLFKSCNMTAKQHKRHKKRNRNRIRRSRCRSKPKTKYLNNSKCSINCYSSIRPNSVDNACYCANYDECCKVNLKNSYLTYIWLYFQNKNNILQIVIVLILLALITTTAHSIDTQEKPQRKTTTSPQFSDAVSVATGNFNESIRTIFCHHISNTTASAESNFKLSLNICHNLRHMYHRYRNGRRHLKLHSRNVFTNLNLFRKKSSKWLTIYKRINIKTNSYNESSIQMHYDKFDDNFRNQNDSTTAIYKQQKNYKNLINNKNAKRTINNLNINMLFQHIPINKYNKSKKPNNNYNKTAHDMEKMPKQTQKDEYANVMVNDTKKNVSDNVDGYYDRVEIKNFNTSRNLLPPVTSISSNKTVSHSLQSIHNQQQHVDHVKLMKLVMDGLGLKKLPNMEKVNISQEEYITKYQEYLQRVYKQKRHELQDVFDEYDEHLLRPLRIFSIVSNSTLISQYQKYKKSYNEVGELRQKRNILGPNNDRMENDYDEGRKKSLEERIRNIFLLKKKYQKPRSTKKERNERKTIIRLVFALNSELLNLSSSDIEEANVRLVLIHSPILAIRSNKNKKTRTKPRSNSCGSKKYEGRKTPHQINVLNLKLYYISRAGKRILLVGRKVDIHVDLTKPDETHTQWVQFEVSKAVKTSIDDNLLQNVVLELQCDNCKRVGARILNDAYNIANDALADELFTKGHQLMPVLNIIVHFDQSRHSIRPHKYENYQSELNEEATTQRHFHHQTYNNNKNRNNRRTNCYKANQRCCRHSMEVTFKEIKGFEFIIQPKVFDAGYCHGRCPPRYNPAHHHALLQSLIWKQNHNKAPRPCCAPSKLVELEVLHVDETDSEKLKISTWSDMKVVECACS